MFVQVDEANKLLYIKTTQAPTPDSLATPTSLTRSYDGKVRLFEAIRADRSWCGSECEVSETRRRECVCGEC